MKHHNFIGSCSVTAERFCIEGVNLFKYNWETIGDVVIVLHPKTKVPLSFSAYKITVGSKEMDFVAGKLDENHWGFFEY